jgi:hypothetical protein
MFIIFSTRLLEKYSTSVGRNNSHHVRPVRQCLGRQSRSRVGSLLKYHPPGRLIVDLTAFFQLPRQIALFVIGVAGILLDLASSS